MRRRDESARITDVRNYFQSLDPNDAWFQYWNPHAGRRSGPDNYAMHYVAMFKHEHDALIFKLKFSDLKYGIRNDQIESRS